MVLKMTRKQQKVLGTSIMILTFLLLFLSIGSILLEQCLENKRLSELENTGYVVEELTEFKILEAGMGHPIVNSYMIVEHNGFKLKSYTQMGEEGETIKLNAKRYYSKDGVLKEVILK